MLKSNFNLNQIVYSFTPRQTGVSFVWAYHFTGLFPSQFQESISNSKLAFNLDFEKLSSGKIYDLYSKITQNYKSINWNICIENGILYQPISFLNSNPSWVSAAKSNISFEKIYEVQSQIANIFYFPFVAKVFIAYSAVLDQSNPSSDIDLILVSKPFLGVSTTIITRFWLKIYFKIIRRDVHPFLIHYFWLLAGFLGLKKLEIWLQKHYFDYKNSARVKFDLGLIVDQSVDLDTYISPNLGLLGYLARRQVFSERDIDPQLDFSNNIFLNSFKYRNNWFKSLLKMVFEILSILFYPIFALQYFWFWLFNRHNINQYVSFRIWHSFTKVGFDKHRIFRLSFKTVYNYHQ